MSRFEFENAERPFRPQVRVLRPEDDVDASDPGEGESGRPTRPISRRDVVIRLPGYGELDAGARRAVKE